MTPLASDEERAATLFAELLVISGISRQQFADFETLSPADQSLYLDGLRAQTWTHKTSATWPTILSILGVLGTIAGTVTGVAGAVAALRAL